MMSCHASHYFAAADPMPPLPLILYFLSPPRRRYAMLIFSITPLHDFEIPCRCFDISPPAFRHAFEALSLIDA